VGLNPEIEMKKGAAIAGVRACTGIEEARLVNLGAVSQ